MATGTRKLSAWTAELVTRDGSKLDVRPAAVADLQEVSEFLKAVTSEDLRFRFLSSVTPSKGLARMLTCVDHSNVENLLAFDARDGRLAASAMIAAESQPGVAEVALVVRSDLKGKGIGWAMLSHTCDYARLRGFRRVECIESCENRAAISIEHELGFQSRTYPGDATLTILSRDLE